MIRPSAILILAVAACGVVQPAAAPAPPYRDCLPEPLIPALILSVGELRQQRDDLRNILRDCRRRLRETVAAWPVR